MKNRSAQPAPPLLPAPGPDTPKGGVTHIVKTTRQMRHKSPARLRKPHKNKEITSPPLKTSHTRNRCVTRRPIGSIALPDPVHW